METVPPAEDQPKTKECISCDQVIGESEKVCPKCGVNQEEVELHLAELERAQNILRKRRKKATKQTTEPVTQPAKEPTKKKGLFKGLLSLRK